MNSLFKMLFVLGGSPSRIYTGNTFTVDGPTHLLPAQPLVGTIWNPEILWHNGNTYIVTKQNQNSADGLAIITKYNGSSLQTVTIPDVSLNKNYHDYTTVSVDNNGYIYVFLEQHNANPRIYKSTNPEDISVWTKLSPSIPVSNSSDYMKTAFIEGIGHINISRCRSPYGLYFKSSTDAATWTGHRVTSAITESGSTDYRHYPHIPINWIQDDFVHVGLYKRITVGGDLLYVRLWKLKTPNNAATIGKVWYNEQETFNKDVTVSGELTEAELNTNFLVWYDSSLTNLNQDFYSILEGGKFKYQQTFTGVTDGAWFEYNAGWQRTTSDAKLILNMKSGSLHTIKDGGSNLQLTELDDNNNSIPGSAVDLLVKSGGNYGKMIKSPMNLDQIPLGSKYLVAANSFKGDWDAISGLFSNDLVIWEMIKR